MESSQVNSEWADLLSPGAKSPVMHENPVFLEHLDKGFYFFLAALMLFYGAKALGVIGKKD